MDHFGIGAALLGAARIYSQSARRSGRTTSLLESLNDGDRVCCADRASSDDLRRRIAERKLKVEVITISPSRPDEISQRSTSTGRTLFDHSWVEQYYQLALEHAAASIDHFQRQSSGFGTAHIETRRKAEELAKWQ
jgi:hypothetical protein